MLEFLKIAEQAARTAGKLLDDLQGRCQVWSKGPKDFVTEADIAAQRVIRETLLGAYPTHGFIGEEDQAPQAWNNDFVGHRWIVDPLDGTANFVHQLPSYAVSIALEHSGEIVVGVVFDPASDECFSAIRGHGAMLNGEPIQVSRCEQFGDAMAAASFAPNVQRGSEEIARFVEVLLSCHSLRRLGSAALNLCYLASGRLDAYWATSVKAWDVAAGALIARESGAVVTALDGSPFDLRRPKLAGSANSLLHEQFLGILRQAASEKSAD
jgi:myo-inositol-1(or 4)-monophosphatase